MAPYCNSEQEHSLGRYADISPQKSAVAAVANNREAAVDFIAVCGFLFQTRPGRVVSRPDQIRETVSESVQRDDSQAFVTTGSILNTRDVRFVCHLFCVHPQEN